MTSGEARSLAEQAARQVEEAISAAHDRAGEILAAAEREAERIRSAAEEEAEQRIRRAQEAVDDLVAQAGGLRDAISGAGRAEAAEPEPAEPEPTELEREPSEPESQPPPAPQLGPAADRRSTEDLIEQLKGAPARPDEAGARLVAMKMALDGKPRAEVEEHLAASFELEGAEALLDDVYSRVGK